MFGLSEDRVREIVEQEIRKALSSTATATYVESLHSNLEKQVSSLKEKVIADSEKTKDTFNKWSADAVKNINNSVDGKINTTRKSLENEMETARRKMSEEIKRAVDMVQHNASNHVELQTDIVKMMQSLEELEKARNQSISQMLQKISEVQVNQVEMVRATTEIAVSMKKQSDLCVRLLEKANQTNEELLRLLAPKIEIKQTDLSLKLTSTRSKKAKNGNKL